MEKRSRKKDGILRMSCLSRALLTFWVLMASSSSSSSSTCSAEPFVGKTMRQPERYSNAQSFIRGGSRDVRRPIPPPPPPPPPPLPRQETVRQRQSDTTDHRRPPPPPPPRPTRTFQTESRSTRQPPPLPPPPPPPPRPSTTTAAPKQALRQPPPPPPPPPPKRCALPSNRMQSSAPPVATTQRLSLSKPDMSQNLRHSFSPPPLPRRHLPPPTTTTNTATSTQTHTPMIQARPEEEPLRPTHTPTEKWPQQPQSYNEMVDEATFRTTDTDSQPCYEEARDDSTLDSAEATCRTTNTDGQQYYEEAFDDSTFHSADTAREQIFGDETIGSSRATPSAPDRLAPAETPWQKPDLPPLGALEDDPFYSMHAPPSTATAALDASPLLRPIFEILRHAMEQVPAPREPQRSALPWAAALLDTALPVSYSPDAVASQLLQFAAQTSRQSVLQADELLESFCQLLLSSLPPPTTNVAEQENTLDRKDTAAIARRIVVATDKPPAPKKDRVVQRRVTKTRTVPRETILSSLSDYEADLGDSEFEELLQDMHLTQYAMEEYEEIEEQEEQDRSEDEDYVDEEEDYEEEEVDVWSEDEQDEDMWEDDALVIQSPTRRANSWVMVDLGFPRREWQPATNLYLPTRAMFGMDDGYRYDSEEEHDESFDECDLDLLRESNEIEWLDPESLESILLEQDELDVLSDSDEDVLFDDDSNDDYLVSDQAEIFPQSSHSRSYDSLDGKESKYDRKPLGIEYHWKRLPEKTGFEEVNGRDESLTFGSTKDVDLAREVDANACESSRRPFRILRFWEWSWSRQLQEGNAENRSNATDFETEDAPLEKSASAPIVVSNTVYESEEMEEYLERDECLAKMDTVESVVKRGEEPDWKLLESFRNPFRRNILRFWKWAPFRQTRWDSLEGTASTTKHLETTSALHESSYADTNTLIDDLDAVDDDFDEMNLGESAVDSFEQYYQPRPPPPPTVPPVQNYGYQQDAAANRERYNYGTTI